MLIGVMVLASLLPGVNLHRSPIGDYVDIAWTRSPAYMVASVLALFA